MKQNLLLQKTPGEMLIRVAFLLVSILLGNQVMSQGPFPPAAGQPGSTAIHKDHPSFQSWAAGSQVVRGWVNIADTSVYVGGSNRVSFGRYSDALGPAEGTSVNVISLGDAGTITLTFDRPVINGPGFDFAVFENGFTDNFLELGFVEVSSDGQKFVRFPAVSLTQTQTQVGTFGLLDPTYLHNLGGKYRQGYGTPFDLNDLADSSGIDLNNIRFVRIRDVIGSIDPQFATYDSQGNIINDPFPTPFESGGFDLDAVGIINGGNQYHISYFDELNLQANSFWNGSDGSGGFHSGSAFFPNNYDPAWGSWSGWAYSNMRDVTTPGWVNQYSAITGGGMSNNPQTSDIFALAFVPIDYLSGTFQTIPVEVHFTGDSAFLVNGLYVTNSTMAALSMRYGDSYAKKFGGVTGNDPDYFKLKAWGIRQDNSPTDTVEFYLADYRFEDNSLDYIVTDWRWFDLSALGVVKGLFFDLESSDVGNFGMNTPSYFCIDQLSLAIPSSSQISAPTETISCQVYPNPFRENLIVQSRPGSDLRMFDSTGRLLFSFHMKDESLEFSTSMIPEGICVLQIIHSGEIQTFKLIKK